MNWNVASVKYLSAFKYMMQTTEVVGVKLLRLWVEGLDEMLGGGLPDKNVVLMTGEPGSGYDILAQQIMYQHAVHGEKIAYFSTSRAPDTLRDDLSTFGWNAASLEEQGKWIFHHVPVAGGVQFLAEKIPQAVSEGCWVLVDSLSYLLLAHKYGSVVKTVELILDSARKNGGIHFLILTQKMHDTETETTMQHLADGVMEFTAQESTGGIDRRIRIKKMRRAVYEPRLIPFNITERGITIETAIRIA